MSNSAERQRLPKWMKMKMPKGASYSRVKNIAASHKLNTICLSGNCPNIGDCWGRGTATFLILGDICTRSCKFCGVKTGKPAVVDLEEPQRIAESVKLMELKHCVITSVDRDDLEDGGAKIWAETIQQVKLMNPGIKIETLIPDFQGKKELIDIVINARPDVISHNLETVPRLTPHIRSAAQYNRSLDVLKIVATAGIKAKSGIMLGLGEQFEEVIELMDDLIASGCSILTIGQYLAPTMEHIPVVEFIKPELFEEYKKIGLEKGFTFVESKPLVRSSYRAELHAQ